MFYCDYHIHTKYSFDGDASASAESICAEAVNKGLTHIAITDHFEANSSAEGLYSPYDASSAYEDIITAKEKYLGRLDVTYGMEIGQANQYSDIANGILREFPVEFVLASLHNLKGMQDFYFMDFSAMPEDEIYSLYKKYLSEVSEIIRALDKIDAIGHITYPHRYIAGAGIHFDLSRFCDDFELIFAEMIKRNIALEINSSTYTKGLGFCMPERTVLSLYRECGGELITIGSDAHSPNAVGSSYDIAVALARECGFTSALVLDGGKKTAYEF